MSSYTRQGRKQWQIELDSRGAMRFEWAEKFATAAICTSWDRYSTLLGEFDRDDLFSRELRLIWDAACSLQAAGLPVDAIAIADRMNQLGTLEDLPEGMHYLLELIDQTEDAISPQHFGEWLKIITRHAALRRFMIGARSILDAAEANRDLESMRVALGGLLDQVPQPIDRREGDLATSIGDELAKIEAGEPESLRVTIDEVDRLTQGFAASELVVLAARPSQGKTMIAVQMVDEAAQAGHASLIVSEEMSIAALARRSITRIVSVEKGKWREEIGQVRFEVQEHFKNTAPIIIREFCVTIDRVERAIASAVNRFGIRFCVVDYAQLVQAKGGNKYEQTSEVSTRLKRAANRHGITIILLAQLGRAIDTRSDCVPMLSDLKDTGQLEQDADVVLAGIWPYKFNNEYPDPHEYRLYQLKNRNRGISESVAKLHIDPIRQRIRTGLDHLPEF